VDVFLTESFDHSRVTALRHSVASRAAHAGLAGDRLADFVVAVNEVVNNAVRHGGGTGRLRLWRDGTSVVCEVTDAGAGMPASRAGPNHRPGLDRPGGRGLWLAGELTDRIEIVTGGGGTTVRVESDAA
jgi:serine/threonine-protein kinase RsbW